MQTSDNLERFRRELTQPDNSSARDFEVAAYNRARSFWSRVDRISIGNGEFAAQAKVMCDLKEDLLHYFCDFRIENRLDEAVRAESPNAAYILCLNIWLLACSGEADGIVVELQTAKTRRYLDRLGMASMSVKQWIQNHFDDEKLPWTKKMSQDHLAICLRGKERLSKSTIERLLESGDLVRRGSKGNYRFRHRDPNMQRVILQNTRD